MGKSRLKNLAKNALPDVPLVIVAVAISDPWYGWEFWAIVAAGAVMNGGRKALAKPVKSHSDLGGDMVEGIFEAAASARDS